MHKRDAHIRAFASQTIDCISVLSIFVDVVVGPAAQMPEHVRSLKLMHRICIILMRSVNINTHVDELDS